MSLAALYDIHGNLPALEAVLDEVAAAGVDRIVVGGDAVPGPMQREVLRRLLALDLPVHFIRGNGEREVLNVRAGGESPAVPEQFRSLLRWSAQELDANDAGTLSTWPLTFSCEVSGIGEVLFCHATPRDDNEIFTRLTPEAQLTPIFAAVDAVLVVCGHTHMQFDRMIGRRRVVNAGSVGMPFGDPGAYWALLGPRVELRRTNYDLAAAADRVRASRYPGAEQFAAHNILEPPSESQMLEIFERAAVKS